MHISTTSFKKDYKVHGCHNRSFDDEKLLESFSYENFKNRNALNEPKVPVLLRHTYTDPFWNPPMIISIGQMSMADGNIDNYTEVGAVNQLSYTVDPEQHDLIISGEYMDYLGCPKERSVENLSARCGMSLYFEPTANDNLEIMYIRPYILVSINGFGGVYKYYL